MSLVEYRRKRSFDKTREPEPGKPLLLWSSEASGVRQLQLLDRLSGERRPLTQLAEPVAHAVCAGKDGVVFAAANERGRSRELLRVDWEGRLLPMPGDWARQWRDAKGDRACTQLLETRSAFGQPPRLSLRRADGQGEALLLPGDPPDPLLARVLHDEGKHVRLCMRTLSLSVSEAEMPHLQRLLAEARAVDRSFGVSGAVGMYLAGVWLRLRARFVE